MCRCPVLSPDTISDKVLGINGKRDVVEVLWFFYMKKKKMKKVNIWKISYLALMMGKNSLLVTKPAFIFQPTEG